MTKASSFCGSTCKMSRQMLSASPGSFSRRYRSAFASAAGTPSFDMGFRLNLSMITSRAKHPQQLCDRIVKAIDDPLLERDDGILRDRNVFGTDFCTAPCDVAVPDPMG